ncbi:MAG TPA: hypothetical protein P5567_02250 [Kiritimatiellia bacterium]|nr:hypothetical protein [Kiritimatiellia bacterium]HRZ11255.1 hypothetical protein [Kiritimatiellia bacterium]HSA19106.1 hypothetical protein [Kiritimatiellia bacterium]
MSLRFQKWMLMTALAGATAVATRAGPGDVQINTLPDIIVEPGRYMVTRNLFLPAGIVGTGIQVRATGVTIDLNGFTLDGSNVACGIVQDADTDDLTVLNGYIRSCAQAVQAPGAGNRFKDLGITACSKGITAGNSAVVEGCIFGQNSSADLSLITVGEGSRVSECLMGINSGSTAFEGIECGEGSEVRRILFTPTHFRGRRRIWFAARTWWNRCWPMIIVS